MMDIIWDVEEWERIWFSSDKASLLSRPFKNGIISFLMSTWVKALVLSRSLVGAKLFIIRLFCTSTVAFILTVPVLPTPCGYINVHKRT